MGIHSNNVLKLIKMMNNLNFKSTYMILHKNAYGTYKKSEESKGDMPVDSEGFFVDKSVMTGTSK